VYHAGASTYEEPEELRSTTRMVAEPKIVNPPTIPESSATRNLRSVIVPEFRDAVEVVCKAIALRVGTGSAGAGATKQVAHGDAGSAMSAMLAAASSKAAIPADILKQTEVGYFHFPPYDSAFTYMLKEIVEDYALLSKRVGEEPERHTVVYSEAFKPVEVLELEKEEADLEAEAAALRAREAALLQASIAATAKTAPKAKSGKPAPDAEPVAAVRVTPLFPKRDKRSIAEIQEELKKRRRTEYDQAGESKGMVEVPNEETETSK
jgi:hypothetical protein